MPRRILLACPQRIGDVLLATPLARSLKRAWPEAEVDMLVFQGTEAALAENPDLAEVIVVPRRAGFAARVAELRRLWRRYDLALAPLATDRARWYCWVAGRRRVGLVNPGLRDRAKTLLLNQSLSFDDRDTHTVAMGLRLAESLGIRPCFEVVPPGVAPENLDALLARLDALFFQLYGLNRDDAAYILDQFPIARTGHQSLWALPDQGFDPSLHERGGGGGFHHGCAT